MSTPKQIAANRLNAQGSVGPRSVEGKPASRANSLKTDPCARSLVIAFEPPPEAKANFLQPQSAQQIIGFVPSFCPTPEPDGAEPLPLVPEGPSHRCWNPSADCTEAASETSSPARRLFSAASAEFIRPGSLGVEKLFSPSSVFPKTVTQPLKAHK